MAGGAPLPPDRARAMRMTATLLLVAMAGLFIVAETMLTVHPAWGYVHAFAEAGMIGGIADWFAVTALFRHPLGLPIPHTAIIPSNKDRIADTMAAFLRTNFLTPVVVARRMQNMNVAKAAGDFLAKRGDSTEGRVRAGAAQLFVELLESLDPDRLGLQVKAGLARQAEKIDIAPLLGRMLEAAIGDNRHGPLMDGMIRWAGLTLEDNEDMVRDMVAQRANSVIRWAGLDGRLANSVLDGLYKLLAEILVDPEHPLRGKVQEGLEKLAQDLQHDAETRAKVEQMKADLLNNPAVADWWMGVWERLRTSLIARIRRPEGGMDGEIGHSLAELGQTLQSDPALQMQVNRFARRTLVGTVNRYGEQIVSLVSTTVKSWDATTITGRIERAVGRDLQFIRINGTLVGGLVGVTIHFITEVI
ncbi:membrane protein [Aurantiacibacter gangjinensis]|uniref:Membrane protein n=2 Tax=Aurantiacibacter gangjinensis TaxID=502682 RepID=A0A0G9MND6_9SPHN|nr:membrane protein [Aurantiacibacter gangjinensis]